MLEHANSGTRRSNITQKSSLLDFSKVENLGVLVSEDNQGESNLDNEWKTAQRDRYKLMGMVQ